MTLKQKHFLNTNFTSDHFIFFDLLSVLIQHMSWWGLRNTLVIYKYTLLQIKKEKNLKWLIISNTYLFNCLTIINNIFSGFSYSTWLYVNNLNPTDILSYGSMSKLIETLGLQKYLKKETCNTNEGLYKNSYQGWTSGILFLGICFSMQLID